MSEELEKKESKRKEDEKKIPPLPEAEYLDDLKPAEKKKLLVQDFFGKPWVRWTGVVLVPILLLVVLFPKKDRKVSKSAPGSELKREIITRAAMDRAIDVAKRDQKEKPVVEMRRETSSAGKRKYASDIAVYVFKEEKAPGQSHERKGNREEKSLGLPSGTKVPAFLLDRVFSFNVNAPVLAIVSKDLSWKEQVVIPKDSQFLGEASVLQSIDRINVSFNLLVLPDGREIRVHAMALSEDGSNGIKGKVEKHRDLRVFKAIGESLLGGASLFVGGVSRDPYNIEDQLRMNLAQNLTNQASQDLRSVRVDQSITVEAYTPIQVIILESI